MSKDIRAVLDEKEILEILTKYIIEIENNVDEESLS
jgi:hypothetical protein